MLHIFVLSHLKGTLLNWLGCKIDVKIFFNVQTVKGVIVERVTVK